MYRYVNVGRFRSTNKLYTGLLPLEGRPWTPSYLISYCHPMWMHWLRCPTLAYPL